MVFFPSNPRQFYKVGRCIALKIVFIKEILHSNKKDKDFYVVRYALIDEKKNVVSKSEPLLWVTKEVYDSLTF